MELFDSVRSGVGVKETVVGHLSGINTLGGGRERGDRGGEEGMPTEIILYTEGGRGGV